MSVIAKMNVSAVRDFGSGSLIELSCVCSNDLMAAYAESEEDKLFTKYSPWGDARVHLVAGAKLPMHGDQFYVMVLSPDEAGEEPHPKAAYTSTVALSLTDRGEGQAKQVVFSGGKGGVVTALHWSMSVDNPGATDQFIPGLPGYSVGFYPAIAFDRDEAIAAAHGRA